jgi:hypothetical protein
MCHSCYEAKNLTPLFASVKSVLPHDRWVNCTTDSIAVLEYLKSFLGKMCSRTSYELVIYAETKGNFNSLRLLQLPAFWPSHLVTSLLFSSSFCVSLLIFLIKDTCLFYLNGKPTLGTNSLFWTVSVLLVQNDDSQTSLFWRSHKTHGILIVACLFLAYSLEFGQ